MTQQQYPQAPPGQYPQQGYPPAPPQPQYPQQPAPPQQYGQQPQYPQAPAYPQQQAYPPPPPAQPLAQGTIDDFYNQPSTGGGPSLKFEQLNTRYVGIVARPLGPGDVQQQTDTQNRPLYFKDGRPKWVLKVPLQMQPSQDYPDGKAQWYVKGGARDELTRAMAEAGATGEPKAGAVIDVTFVSTRNSGPGMNPAKVFRITYTPPQGQSQEQGQQQAQAAPQPPAQQAPPPAPPQPQGVDQAIAQQGPPPQWAQPQQQAAPQQVPPEQGVPSAPGPAAQGVGVPPQAPTPPQAQAQPSAPQPPADLSPEQQQLLAQLTASQQG